MLTPSECIESPVCLLSGSRQDRGAVLGPARPAPDPLPDRGQPARGRRVCRQQSAVVRHTKLPQKPQFPVASEDYGPGKCFRNSNIPV